MSNEHEHVVPLNYTTHFREWWRGGRDKLAKSGFAKTHVNAGDFIAALDVAYILAGASQRFLLPNNGWVLDETGVLDGKYAGMMRLPFPVTAFEFTARRPMEDDHLVGNQLPSRKRIALCVDRPTSIEIGIASADSFGGILHSDTSGGFCLLGINFLEGLGWNLTPGIAVIGNESKWISAEETLDHINDPAIRAQFPDWDDLVRRRTSSKEGLITATQAFKFCDWSSGKVFVELRDEMVAAVQACASLACANVSTWRTQEPIDLNRKRVSRGKEPLVSYHVLELTGEYSACTSPGGGHHASPRQHLRRGHIRRLSDSRSTWVRAAVVGSASNGIALKDYAMPNRTQATA